MTHSSDGKPRKRGAFFYQQRTVNTQLTEKRRVQASVTHRSRSEIRAATYQAHRQRALAGRVLFALDEAANIAPLGELPQIASEGGGRGLALLAAFQDLSQARARWGDAADGFLTLFGAKVILPGVADPKSLEAISIALGEYDRQVVAETRSRGRDSLVPTTSRTVSTQRQRVLAPGEIANLPAGHALYLDGLAWRLLTLTPAHRAEPWRSLSQTGQQRSAPGRRGTSWDVLPSAPQVRGV